jgi:hypothetical protein
VPGAAGGATADANQTKTLLDEAKQAFAQGNNKEGFGYLYAHYLCADNGASELKKHLRWAPAPLRRPVVALQFGIGVAYSAPPDYKGNPMAIGNDEQNKPQQTGEGGEGRRGRRSRGGPPGAFPGAPGAPGAFPGAPGAPGAFPGAPGAPGAFPGAPGFGGGEGGSQSGPRGELDYYTGELGMSLLERLEEKMLEGVFGDAIRELELPTPGSGGNAGGGFRGFPGAPAGIGAPGAPMGIGPPGAAAGIGAPDGGDGGIAPGGGGGGAGRANGKPGEPQGIVPGITYLGHGSEEAIERKAKEQGVDVLILYDVKVARPGRTGVVRNTTKIRVTLVARPNDPPLHSSASLTNVEVAAERDKGKDDDPVDVEMNKLFAAIEKLKVAPMPGLNTAIAEKRVTDITSSAPDNPLLTLVEAKYYEAEQLISAEFFANAAKAVLGDKAQALKAGKEEERKAALAQYLPRKVRQR